MSVFMYRIGFVPSAVRAMTYAMSPIVAETRMDAEYV